MDKLMNSLRDIEIFNNQKKEITMENCLMSNLYINIEE
jgi:hypothetical protein